MELEYPGRMIPDDTGAQDIINSLSALPDLEACLIGQAILERSMQNLLMYILPNVDISQSNDKKYNIHNPFSDGRFLDAFTSKIELAYFTDLISKDVYDDLRLIAKIRNQFGHSIERVKFQHNAVSSLCHNLKLPAMGDAFFAKLLPGSRNVSMGAYELAVVNEEGYAYFAIRMVDTGNTAKDRYIRSVTRTWAAIFVKTAQLRPSS